MRHDLSPLTLLNYPLEQNHLIEIYRSLAHQAENYVDTRFSVQSHDWKILRLEPALFSNLFNDLGVWGQPRFYHLKQNAHILPHVDNKTLCSVNFILGDPEPAPIRIEGVDYYYTQALLNTQRRHEVKNDSKERLLFKISIFDESYESIAQRIRYKK